MGLTPQSLYHFRKSAKVDLDFQSIAVEATDNFHVQFLAWKLNVIFGELLVQIFLDR